MAINLKKGQGINLTKAAPKLRIVRVGIGWDITRVLGQCDLDVCAFVLKTVGEVPVCLSDEHFVFFNNLQSPEGFLTHTGDNRTGVGEGDDETLKVDLAAAPADAAEVSFIVTMHEALARRQHFGMIQNAYLKVYNDETGEVLAEYDLDEEFAGQTAVQIGSLFRAGNEWQFQAVGAGYQRELLDFVRGYGLEA